MPFSTTIFKQQILEFITKSANNTDVKILDIGAGCGTYADLLSPQFTNIDAMEVFFPYVEQYNLREKYKNVFIENVMHTSVDFSQYDFIILGDILEHLNLNDSRSLIQKLLNTSAELIITVPFNAPQGTVNENVHEIHLQPKLTLTSFLRTHKKLIPLCVRYDYGVFIKNTKRTEYTPVFYDQIEDTIIEKLQLAFPYKKLIDTYKQVTLHTIDEIFTEEIPQNVTIVTALWDLGRESISAAFKRSYEHYKEKFAELLKTPVNMIIFVAPEDEEFIWKHRSRSNTMVKILELKEFKLWFEHFNSVQQIRKTESWYSQASWLKESPQATLEYYNPVVMSKMFMLNNATIFNPFDTEYFFWLDAGITSTVHPGYFTHDKVLNNLSTYVESLNQFLFLSYPYTDGTEIHGFDRKEITKYCEVTHVNYVCRGGFFGGKKSLINKINGLYYAVLTDTLQKQLMGTEESIFTILAHQYPEFIYCYELLEDGLVWRFFEKLKDVKELTNSIHRVITPKTAKTNLYVLGFNSPNQFKSVCESIKQNDPDMFVLSRKILINNSIDTTLFPEYDELCTMYGFEEIHRENLGVCGGRQFAAEHFDESDADFSMFFEDDMHVNGKDTADKLCKCGLTQYVPNLYTSIVKIMLKEKFDFLKFSFSEFYGDNSKQWAWYNVPQEIRTQTWPSYDKLPETGLDPNSPYTRFYNIKVLDGVAYATGEVYYSNWPQIVSKEGNRKMFLETRWAFPYEQTWMSHIFQETLNGNINPGILVASPITHDRVEFYPAEERREN